VACSSEHADPKQESPMQTLPVSKKARSIVDWPERSDSMTNERSVVCPRPTPSRSRFRSQTPPAFLENPLRRCGRLRWNSATNRNEFPACQKNPIFPLFSFFLFFFFSLFPASRNRRIVCFFGKYASSEVRRYATAPPQHTHR